MSGLKLVNKIVALENERDRLKAELAKINAYDWKGCQSIFKELTDDRDAWKAKAEALAEGMRDIRKHCETLTNDFNKLGAWNIAVKCLAAFTAETGKP